jgi:hypothetical protein
MTYDIKDLRASNDAGIVAGKSGQSPNSQPYGKSVPGVTTKKITAWFFGYIDGRSIIRRCGTANVS